MDSFENILFEISDDIATLTLNRPQALNALTFELMAETETALAEVARDKTIRALIVTGAGRGFCSGQDLRNRAPEGSDIVSIYTDKYFKPINALRTCRVPVIMAVNGTAAGGGFSLALAGDIMLAARSAKFIQVFSRIGLIPDLGSSYLLPRAVGRARALRMMMTNEAVSAEQGVEWGFVSEVFDDNDLLPAAHDLAQKLAIGPTLALTQTRAAVDEGEVNSFEAQFRRELEINKIMRESHDGKEGVAAFVEKRQAVFKGE